jgi:hypothetical protein
MGWRVDANGDEWDLDTGELINDDDNDNEETKDQ